MNRINLVALLCICATGVSAQTITSFSLSHGNASYAENNLIGTGTRTTGGTADFRTTAGGPENLYQNWWWYNTQNTTQEYALGNQVSGSSAGSQARIVYLESGGPNNPDALIFDINYTLTQLSAGRAVVQIGWKIHNLSAETLRVNFFGYADFDLNGGGGDDTGTFIAPNHFRLGDSNPNVTADLTASTTGLFGWEQGAWPTVRNKLTNTTIDNLANSPGAFGPGDWSGAFQWQFSLAPNGTPNGKDQMVGSLVKLVNNPVPEPATILALSSGVALLLRRRRR